MLEEPCSCLCLSDAISLQSLCLFVNISSRSSLHFSFLLAFFFDTLTALAMCAGTCECILVCHEMNGFL